MIWYKVPPEISIVLLIAFLLSTAGQIAVVLNAGGLIRELRGWKFFRLIYISFMIISLFSLSEMIVAVASIEGGLCFPIPSLPRYIFVMPALLYFYAAAASLKIPSAVKPVAASFFIPLLRLPPGDRLPMPLPVIFTLITAAWFISDAIWILLSVRKHTRIDITRSLLLHVIHNLNHGVCIADSHGRILEYNPVFDKLCHNLGISGFDHVFELDKRLKDLQTSRQLIISAMESGKAIRRNENVYFLQCEDFILRKKRFMQLALSDITVSYRKTIALEKKNERLARKNRELEKAISNVSEEVAIQEREKFCRASHDSWSQRMAVAGLSLDILIKQDNGLDGELQEILNLLENPATDEHIEITSGLYDLLSRQTELYQRLGIEIHTSGQAEFSKAQQTALCHVLREALANAVRHAYASQIEVCFFEDDTKTEMTVCNDCPDNKTMVIEGRGLHDIKARLRDVGGIFCCEKNKKFLLRVTFEKDTQQNQEVLTG